MSQEPHRQRTIDERLDALTSTNEQLVALNRRTDERLGAIAESLELLTHDVQQLSGNVQQLSENSKRDAENIRALARIAEIHERRLTEIEGDQPTQ